MPGGVYGLGFRVCWGLTDLGLPCAFDPGRG